MVSRSCQPGRTCARAGRSFPPAPPARQLRSRRRLRWCARRTRTRSTNRESCRSADDQSRSVAIPLLSPRRRKIVTGWTSRENLGANYVIDRGSRGITAPVARNRVRCVGCGKGMRPSKFISSQEHCLKRKLTIAELAAIKKARESSQGGKRATVKAMHAAFRALIPSDEVS